MVLFLLLASAGTYFAYEKYFKPIQTELVKNEKKSEKLQSKIENLEKIFKKTKPPIVLEVLEEDKQPWMRASRDRLAYFRAEESEKVDIPDDEFPHFWYAKEYPKMQDELYQFAREKGVQLAVLDFNIKTPEYFEGSSPTRKEIIDEVNKYNYGVKMTKFILEAKPKYLERVSIWPKRIIKPSKSGDITMITTGYKMQIMNEDLLRFLVRLDESDTYVNVSGLKVINKSLRNPKAPLEVEILITSADIVSTKKVEE